MLISIEMSVMSLLLIFSVDQVRSLHIHLDINISSHPDMYYIIQS